MASGYEDRNKKPDPQYTVTVRVVEVIPPHQVSGGGLGVVMNDRSVDEVVNIVLRAGSVEDAMDKAVAHLTVVRDS
jgi:hypothetical protein